MLGVRGYLELGLERARGRGSAVSGAWWSQWLGVDLRRARGRGRAVSVAWCSRLLGARP